MKIRDLLEKKFHTLDNTDIFINPSHRELMRVIGGAYKNACRALVLSDGSCLFWDAYEVTHQQVETDLVGRGLAGVTIMYVDEDDHFIIWGDDPGVDEEFVQAFYLSNINFSRALGDKGYVFDENDGNDVFWNI